MKKYIFPIVIGGTIIILLVNIFRLNHKYSKVADSIENQLKEDSIIISQLSGRIALLYKNSNFRISPKTILVRENEETIMLEDIKFDKYLFVARFSEFNCMSCITNEMKHVGIFLRSNSNVIVLTTYSRHRDLLNNKRVMEIPFPVYNIPFGTFDNEMEKRKLPYYFVIDENYHVRSLFIADPNNYELTDRYLKYVKDLLGKQGDGV
jgi:hypothetical protein